MTQVKLVGPVVLAEQLENVFIATSDAAGLPHVSVARSMELLPDSRVAVREWFCPGTMANLTANPQISLVMWDAMLDRGFQLLGSLEAVQELGMIDGYTPREEINVPQAERRLVIKVDKVLDFTRKPHLDVEE